MITGAPRQVFLQRLLGRRYADLRFLWRRLRLHPTWRLTRRFTRRYGFQVRRGPFKGLTFTFKALVLAENPVAKLLGSYEAEIADDIRQAVREGYEVIV